MLPSRLEAHVTRRHENGNRPPCYPPTPADTRDGADLARGAVLRLHASARSERKKLKEPKGPSKRNGGNKDPQERSGK